MHNKLVNGQINRTLATMQLKTLGLNNYVVTLIVDSAHIRNAMNNNNLEMLNLNSFHTSIDRSNLRGVGYPDFATCKRKNLKHEQMTSSPMHNLSLGICKSSMHLFFELTNKLVVSKYLKDDASKNLFQSYSANIDFLLTTMLNECKTTG